jgi:hypothetical protein
MSCRQRPEYRASHHREFVNWRNLKWPRVGDFGWPSGNVANVKWNDIEYYYVARLKNEPFATPDYIVHAGVPFTVRVHFQYFL